MPLFPVPTYTSWQLACMAAVEPMGGSNPASISVDADVRGELQVRGKSETEVEEMISLAKRIGNLLLPMVCMDIDDLVLGIETQFNGGLISMAEKDRLLAFVAAHVDSARQCREPQRLGTRWTRPILVFVVALGYALVVVAKRGFWLWLGGVVLVVVLHSFLPAWRNYWLRCRHRDAG